MTQKEKTAFAQGVEEGYVMAAERSSDPENILRQFRPISPTFSNQGNWPRVAEIYKMKKRRGR
jgi:hypothetical protein